MRKETITYTDYNNIQRTEDFYFNLSKAELTEMNLSVEGGIEPILREIISTKDIPKLAECFKKIITMSYGKKTPDGRGFKKNPEILDDFVSTYAYSELYMKLLSDTDAAIAFINEVIPEIPNSEPITKDRIEAEMTKLS